MLRYALILALFLAPAAYPQTVLLGGMDFDGEDMASYGTGFNDLFSRSYEISFDATFASDSIIQFIIENTTTGGFEIWYRGNTQEIIFQVANATSSATKNVRAPAPQSGSFRFLVEEIDDRIDFSILIAGQGVAADSIPGPLGGGSDLFVGAKLGRSNFFEGSLSNLVIQPITGPVRGGSAKRGP